MASQMTSVEQPFSMSRVLRTWWPLAASWLLMAIELPALSAVVARLANPEINLAAYGGVVFPLSLIIESPIIMLLAASTALSRDWASYLTLRRFMMRLGVALTLLHVAVAFTPLYYIVVRNVLGAPPEIVEPARIGLMIMTPWTWSIAYRRFNQGVLIRFDHSRAVGAGTIIRLTADVLVLTIGYLVHTIPGIVVATSAVIAGVLSEAAFAGLRMRPVLRDQVKKARVVTPPISYPVFIEFYIPLVMTSLLTLLAQPIGSAAISRMPEALQSLAVWPVISGLIFMFRSLGIAYNEVVVALLDEPNASRTLLRFTLIMAALLSTGLLVIAATPLAHLWFQQVSGLSPELANLARVGVWFAIVLPALAALQSWYQGAILHSRRTRAITEAVVIYLVSSAVILSLGVVIHRWFGLYVGLIAMSISTALQTAWLWWRSRDVISAHHTTSAAQLHPAEAATR